MKSEKKISFNSIFTVVAMAENGGSGARKYLNEVKNNLTDSARAMAEKVLGEKKAKRVRKQK